MKSKEKNSLFTKILTLAYKIISFSLIVTLTIFVLTDIFDRSPLVAEYQATPFDKAKSLNNDELRRMLIDKIQTIFTQAKSLKETNSQIKTIANPFSVEISGIKSNYSSLIKYLQNKLGITRMNFSVSLIKIDQEYCYRIRTDDQLISKHCKIIDSIETKSTISHLINKQAIDIVKKTDPYILSMYFFKKEKFKKSLKTSKYALKMDPKSRKYALGTIANSLKELNEHEKALEYYEKSVREYPKFYSTKWKYSELLIVMGRFDKAETVALEVLAKEVKLRQQALTTLLDLYDKKNNEQKYDNIKNKLINNYGIDYFNSLQQKEQ